MINYYHKTNTDDSAKTLEQPHVGSWVYVEAPSHTELSELSSKFNLDKSLLFDALDVDEMPRLEQNDDTTYIFVRFVYEDNGHELKTTPLLFIFGEEHVFTVSLVRLPSLDLLLGSDTQFTTTKPAELFLKILQQISAHYDDKIKEARKQIKQIRARLRNHDISNRDFIDFVEIEDAMNDFLGALQPTNSTLRRLKLDRFLKLFKNDVDIIEDLLLNNEQSIETCHSNIKSISNIRVAYAAISSANLNHRLNTLTVITLILLIPTLFFAMYGMNVPLPYQSRIWALPVISGVAIVICIIFGLMVRNKKSF